LTLEDTDPETMTVERLMDHLSDVPGLERCQISSAIEARSRKAKRAREIKSDRERKKRETENNYTRIRSTSTDTPNNSPTAGASAS
jgi:ferritin-like metal-binding protein YciE